jgi:hypothetical protein
MTGWEAGDILIFFGTDWSSRIIELATRGPSHVGIVSREDDRGLLLYESTTLCDLPDRLTGRTCAGVQAHEPEERVRNYCGRVSRLRLAPAWRLNRYEAQLLGQMLRHVHGAEYDLCGALLSGTRLFKWTSLMPYPDLGSLFCSELCAAVLMRLGRLPLSNPSAYHPAALVRKLRRCGVYQPPEVLATSTFQLDSIIDRPTTSHTNRRPLGS